MSVDPVGLFVQATGVAGLLVVEPLGAPGRVVVQLGVVEVVVVRVMSELVQTAQTRALDWVLLVDGGVVLEGGGTARHFKGANHVLRALLDELLAGVGNG